MAGREVGEHHAPAVALHQIGAHHPIEAFDRLWGKLLTTVRRAGS